MSVGNPLVAGLELMIARTRDPTIWAAAGKVLYEGLSFSYKEYPKKLRTINFPTPSEVSSNPVKAESDAIVLAFLAQLEGFLSTKATPLNYTKLWDETKPDPKLDSLDVFFNRTYSTFISKEQTKNVRDPFYADYAKRYDGRRPFVNPVPLVRTQPTSVRAAELNAQLKTLGPLGIWRLFASVGTRCRGGQQNHLQELVGGQHYPQRFSHLLRQFNCLYIWRQYSIP